MLTSRYIIIIISIILLLITVFINHYEYIDLKSLSMNSDNDNDIKRLLDVELNKRLVSGGNEKLEQLIRLLQSHLEYHQKSVIATGSVESKSTIIQPCICPSIPAPIPCPSVPAPLECPPAGNKPPYFNKLGPINRKLDIGNPDTRDAWIKQKAVTLCGSAAGSSILDVSAGNKPYQTVWQKAGCKYFSNEFGGNVDLIDNFRGESQKNDLKSKHDYIGTDITNTNAPSNTFDIAVLTEVLEHLPEPAKSIPELVRVIKPGGHILVTAPFTSGSHQLPYHFSSGYPREWYQYVAKKNNLEIVEIETQGDYFKLMAQEFHRALTCEPALPEADPVFMKEMIDKVPFHFLARSEKYGKGSCGNQFTIGFMAHFRKPLNQTS